MKKNDIKKLLQWYQENKRDLPWRHTKDAYKIWISETMLQQTRVDTVIPYYERFLKTVPSIKALANVREDILLKLWEGLGYYSRARNLQKAAKMLQNNGLNFLPPIKEELQSLPGIGPYTVGAILSIAYDIPEPAIDGNVLRVLSRVFEEKEEILKPKVRIMYTLILKKLMKNEIPSLFTQSFIELGALVCTKNPLCEECPLRSCCQAYKHHTVLDYPVKKIKKEKPVLLKTVLIFEYHQTFLIRKRKEIGLLANLYEFWTLDFPLNDNDVQEYLENENISFDKIKNLGEVIHIFSHQKWIIKVYSVSLNKKIKDELFVTEKDLLEKYSLPTVFQKAWKLL